MIGDGVQPRGKEAVRSDKKPVLRRDEVEDGDFLGESTRTGDDEHLAVFVAGDDPKAGEGSLHDFGKLTRRVRDGRPCQGSQDRAMNRRRTRDEEKSVLVVDGNHGLASHVATFETDWQGRNKWMYTAVRGLISLMARLGLVRISVSYADRVP